MSIPSLILCAVALSMDAFAVAVCKGLALPRVRLRDCLIVGIWFGFFQALMPTIGYLLTSLFAKYITAYTHWVAFILLSLIGLNMIRESFSKDEACCDEDPSLGPRVMLPLAIATSIDALAVGVTFAMTDATSPNSLPIIVLAAPIIGITTLLLSGVGVKVGNIFGTKYKSKAELVGGIVLVLLGVKTLLSGLGILNLPF